MRAGEPGQDHPRRLAAPLAPGRGDPIAPITGAVVIPLRVLLIPINIDAPGLVLTITKAMG